ncbi:hypothetical protein BDV93DRAFT_516207 [Ceratobasidium sp. AG-I]|nr:hypothetical protein BDV93DRAFT_516207 [Ceratobasidium sp. AG-I]
MRPTLYFSALPFLAPVLCAPTATSIIKRAGPVRPNSYIIGLKESTSLGSALSTLTSGFTGGPSITHIYTIIPAFAAFLRGLDLDLIRRLPSIEYIEQDGTMSIDYEYVIHSKSGIYVEHRCFGGRASWAKRLVA